MIVRIRVKAIQLIWLNDLPYLRTFTSATISSTALEDAKALYIFDTKNDSYSLSARVANY